MTESSFIEARGISKAFRAGRGERPVLRHVSLEVRRGEFVAILGAMGSGKSTLLGILAGLTTPDEGTVTIGGEPVRGIRHDTAFVFQNYSLLPWFTALENVRLAVQAAFPQWTRDAQKAKARATLEKVGLGNALNRRPRQLSGGMRQRVAIARALATDPKVLFLDEPFGALDALTRQTLQQELAGLCADGEEAVTTVMITNSVEEAILLSDRIMPIVPGSSAGAERSRGAALGAAIEVALPRPRSAVQLAHDEQATHVRAHVIATLTAALGARGTNHRSALANAVSPGLQPAGEEAR